MSANDWIKVRTVLPTDGRLRIVSRKCHASTVTVFGALVTLWCLADSHADENGTLTGYTCDDIDDHVQVPGFCSSLPADWIDMSGEFVKLPQYQEHNGTTGKSRALATKRQRKHREVTEVSRPERDTSVTREDKKREEKNKEQRPADADLFAGVDPQVVADFRKLRKAKKAEITGTAVDGIKREAAKAGLTLESALRMCCERGWVGFKADWAGGPAQAASRPGGGRRAL
jgi:hypothetical protein